MAFFYLTVACTNPKTYMLARIIELQIHTSYPLDDFFIPFDRRFGRSPSHILKLSRMCAREHVGDYYTACGHFCGLYYSGNTTDCNLRDCKTSNSHIHKPNSAAFCICPAVVTDVRKIQSTWNTKCAECEDAASPDSTSRRRRLRDDWMEHSRSGYDV